MTATRIEELKTLTAFASSADTFVLMLPADTTDVDLKWIEAARNGLARLLEERERLLAALAELTRIYPIEIMYDCQADSGEYDSYEMAKAKEGLRAAIAYAESE